LEVSFSWNIPSRFFFKINDKLPMIFPKRCHYYCMILLWFFWAWSPCESAGWLEQYTDFIQISDVTAEINTGSFPQDSTLNFLERTEFQS
jgi:hypothetical protein